ncbi:VOC family protein [Bradyrhizobium sp. SYSU BS000235]|jgi:predicted 3-demethylubiquinone-9 3-methyltransferase (glyoxalase superfamily)|uniref:VOC family protein n=1 Tax=Bradyrhizobium sp. SYSU BS000235 TaxID=3411332 RepID=UPI003C734936
MANSVRPFLMFQGNVGSAALEFYQSVFPDAKLDSVERYGEGDGPPPGSLKMARLTIAGQTILLHDTHIAHGFNFTPSISLFVESGSEEELRRLATTLAEGGAELMPIANYGFSTLFAWVADRFGVSWQINLP